MVHVRLQFCCLIIVLYFLIAYLKLTLGQNSIKCNRIFDALLAVSPWAIFFDGLTAWTVNNQDIVPRPVNVIFHGLFFACMNMVLVFIFQYMLNKAVGTIKKSYKVIMIVIEAVAFILMIAFLPELRFEKGTYTDYSMGISVYICVGSMFVHFIMMCTLIAFKHHTIPKGKKLGMISLMVIGYVVLGLQIFFPELLLTSIMPTICIVSVYINFENPALARLKESNSEMVSGFATLVENRDDSTGGHILRTKGYVEILIEEMKRSGKYGKMLSADYIDFIDSAAPMHDIGKVSTPDYILQKPGKLTDEEYAIMKKHAEVGGEIIKETFASMKEPEFLLVAYEVARYHHEKWNGKGYPEGLKEKQIPLHARVMAIADVFDAVSSKRCYRDEMPLDVCFKIIEDGAGTDFDPQLVELFLGAKDKIIAFYNKNKSDERHT